MPVSSTLSYNQARHISHPLVETEDYKHRTCLTKMNAIKRGKHYFGFYFFSYFIYMVGVNARH